MSKRKFYGMKNDLVFHAVLQESETVLRALISALMNIPEEEIKSCRVLNPIDYGKAFDAKEIILDVRLILNDETSIDIELQVRREKYWIARSLLYWSRSYDILHTGDNYEDLRTACHIGILDHTLFKDDPSFYSEYRIRNVIMGREYSDKMRIIILDLTKREMAKATEQEMKLLKWANIFQAESMEELEELCKEYGEEYEEMLETIKKLSEDDEFRMKCEARERYRRDMHSQYKTGYEDGVEEEKENTKKEAARADAAENRADEAEKTIEILRMQINRLKNQLQS